MNRPTITEADCVAGRVFSYQLPYEYIGGDTENLHYGDGLLPLAQHDTYIDADGRIFEIPFRLVKVRENSR